MRLTEQELTKLLGHPDGPTLADDGNGSTYNLLSQEAQPRARRATKKTLSEHEEQVAFIAQARGPIAQLYPGAEKIFAVPNGGFRHAATAGKLKAEGVVPGVCDLLYPVPRGNYSGLAIEMKVGANKPTKSQLEFMVFLRSCGWAVYVCYGCDEAVSVFVDYLQLPARKEVGEMFD